MMDLSVIILNWNTKELLKDCLTSVFNQTQKINLEVIVVDNGSADGSVAMVKEKFPQVVLIENKTNLGFAKANNQGIKKSRGGAFVLLNSDTKIKDRALEKLLAFAKAKKNLAVAGPQLLSKDSTPQPSTAPFYSLPIIAISLLKGDKFLRRLPQKSRPVDWLSGACFLIKREALQKIGLLDERFFMYVEEMEFCYRAKKAGFQTWYYPEAQVYHFVRGSSPADWRGKQKAIWWIYQGLIYFYQKHFAPWQLAVLKFLLGTKAVLAWLVGVLTGSRYLKQTYGKAFKLAK